jgi:hypothetical protein
MIRLFALHRISYFTGHILTHCCKDHVWASHLVNNVAAWRTDMGLTSYYSSHNTQFLFYYIMSTSHWDTVNSRSVHWTDCIYMNVITLQSQLYRFKLFNRLD